MLETLDKGALRALVLGHEEQEGLCRTLERIADALPQDIDPALCKAAAGTIHRVMTRVALVERDVLSRLDAPRGPVRVDLAGTVERLLRENEEDLSYADELQEALDDFGKGKSGLSADALSYMLRSFFQSRRRRIALEREILDALAPATPSPLSGG